VNLRTSGRFRAPTTDLGQKFAQHVQRPREGVEFFRDRVAETAAVDAISARGRRARRDRDRAQAGTDQMSR